MTDQPLVSCLMVTANRSRLAQRAVDCLAQQTWPNTELVIIDDGEEDYTPILEPYAVRLPIHYHRVAKDPDLLLGGLRNRTLDLAKGDYCVQWDDDEWYAPERIETQMQYLQRHELDAVVLRYVLVHLDEPDYVERAFRFDSVDGTCGTILHRRTTLRYPNQRRSEDLVFLERFGKEGRVGCMEAETGHLFVRCFHGSNTWDRKHFHSRLRKTFRDEIDYFVCRYLLRDIFRHRNFQLTSREEEALANLLEQSRRLGLLETAPAAARGADVPDGA